MQGDPGNISDWLDLWGRDRNAASEVLLGCGATAGAVLVRKGRVRKADAEDVPAEAILRLLANDARRLRKAPPERPLWAHFHGVARRVALERGREAMPRRALPDQVAGVPSTDNGDSPGSADLDMSAMTVAQRNAFELHLRGTGARAAARAACALNRSHPLPHASSFHCDSPECDGGRHAGADPRRGSCA